MQNKLLLLHGALGSGRQLEGIAQLLKDRFEVFSLDFSGHGGKQMPERGFTIELFAADVLIFIAENKFIGVNVYGYSSIPNMRKSIIKGKKETIEKCLTKIKW